MSTGSPTKKLRGTHADHSARTRKRNGSLSARHRRSARDLHTAGGRISRAVLAGARRFRRRRCLLRHLRLPDQPHHSDRAEGRHVLAAAILRPPCQANIPGADCRFGRDLPDRLVCSSPGRLFPARQEHRGRRRLRVQSVSTLAGRLFCARRDRESAASPLVARHRGAVLHFLAAGPLAAVAIGAAAALDRRHRGCLIRRQPDDLLRLQGVVVLLPDIESLGIAGRRHGCQLLCRSSRT